MAQTKNKPVKQFRAGGNIVASIWRNEVKQNGKTRERHSIQIQKRFRKDNPGCHSLEGYYVIPKGVDYFNREITCVPFNTLREFTLKEELKESWNFNFISRAFLKDNTLKAIINCLKQSFHITAYQKSLLS